MSLHLLVVNYGLGGRYTPHFDSGGWEDRPVPEEMKVYINQAKGERIGTFMAYLSDVEVGGGTGSKPQWLLVDKGGRRLSNIRGARQV